jgi:hypothetical protein
MHTGPGSAALAATHSADEPDPCDPGNRYKESWIRQVFPGWKYPPRLGEQDKCYYGKYNDAIREIASPKIGQGSYSPTVLGASQRMYDEEASRRESINTRCSAVLSTGGILGALFVAAGQLGLAQHKGSFGIATWPLLAVFIIALVYLGSSIIMALAVQGSEKGNVMDPADIRAGGYSQDLDGYNIRLAKKNLTYTVLNYAVNNLLKFQLNSAQRNLRNGIIAIIVAGILSPWALHTTAASTPHLSKNHARAGSFAGTNRAAADYSCAPDGSLARAARASSATGGGTSIDSTWRRALP